MIKTNWYVITGGPSSGKTKTIDYLAFLGYFVVPEAARILIDNEMSRGRAIDEIRADEAEFQKRVLQMKIDVENRIEPDRPTFFERGIPDSIAYYQICGKDISPAQEASQKRKYRSVFLLDSLPFEQDYARAEDKETARRLDQLLYDSYIELDYKVLRVPVMPVDERAQFIVSRLK
ncbi:ATP-binding protein [Candidatus Parcubacteria bacterium]|nr:ATP-binding protein [Candidatus Parcubacteria bacterium]